MAKNTGNNFRNGAVRQRSQVENPKTGQWVKRDATTGQFKDVKSNGQPLGA